MGSLCPGRGSLHISGNVGAGTLSICRAKNGGTGPIALGRSVVIVEGISALMIAESTTAPSLSANVISCLGH
jgi:hypothetical protein